MCPFNNLYINTKIRYSELPFLYSIFQSPKLIIKLEHILSSPPSFLYFLWLNYLIKLHHLLGYFATIVLLRKFWIIVFLACNWQYSFFFFIVSVILTVNTLVCMNLLVPEINSPWYRAHLFKMKILILF